MSIDTPDFQRGVASAQVLLAKEHLPTTSVIVGIPPNAETIVVVFEETLPTAGVAIAFGVVSSINYPSVSTRSNGAGAQWTTFYFDVTNVIDEELEIQLDNATGGFWYVYADTGVHVVGNYAPLVDDVGAQLVVPVIPSGLPGDHPPTELSMGGNQFTANGQLLAPPGAGRRYRIFSAQLSSTVAGLAGVLLDAVSNVSFITCTGVGNMAMPFVPQGVPLSANAAVNYTILSGAGNMVALVQYATETI